MLESLQSFDVFVLNSFRTYVQSLGDFSHIIRFFADLQPILFAGGLIVLWIIGVKNGSLQHKYVALDIFWHVTAAFCVYWIINQGLPMRPRPETVSSIQALITHLPDNSFPSGHAMFWGASWWSMRMLLQKPSLTWIYWTLGLLTCTARVLAGIHYPGDILVGFFVGWLLAILFIRLPHGALYRTYAHDLPVRIAQKMKL